MIVRKSGEITPRRTKPAARRMQLRALQYFYGKYQASPRFLLLWFAVLFLIRSVRERYYPRSPAISRTEYLAKTEFWNGRHLIFAASAGRSGSKYLRNVLACGKNVHALHEPPPQLNGDFLHAVLLSNRRHSTREARMSTKLNAIALSLAGARSNVVYAETSHMFVKTFADVVLDAIGNRTRIHVVILHRPTVDVLASQMRLGWFTANHSGRGLWYYAAEDVHPDERVLPEQKVRADRGALWLLAGYNADVRVRTLQLKEKILQMRNTGAWPNVNVVDVKLESLAPRNTENIEEFLRKVGLAPQRECVRLLGKVDSNSRTTRKERANIHVSRADILGQLKAIEHVFPQLKDFG